VRQPTERLTQSTSELTLGARALPCGWEPVRPKFGETIMEMLKLNAAQWHESMTFCPHCSGENFESNRADERLLIEAAREAPRLRFEGKADEAIEVLTALYALRIANFIKPAWLCLDCGSSFDA
jgi:hypothetical protein